MRRHLALVPFLLLLTACTGQGDKATTTPTGPAAPATAPPSTLAEPTTASTPAATATTAAPSPTVSGPQYAFIKEIKPATRELTYDLVDYFVGKAAVQACADDGEKPGENDWCVGYYIRNKNTKLRTAEFAPGAEIKVVDLGELKKAELGRLEGGMLLRFEIEGGRITEAEQIYLP
ncbi:hypothetical protein [Actinoplanes sichuanensis]|uniref:Lipoprotein n=1 Tax=Actinoplanes sichuanensis TaxID=512349 RepID=A0ABW4ASY0_9ACTN|nr:hypothetical protein [Actinoplanes sichuanensis]